MTKIRKLYFFDKKNVQEMISFLNNSVTDNYINHIMFNPLIPLHHILPLKLKFLPESYVFKDGHEIKGLITIAPINILNNRMEIQKLFFEENSIEIATELIQFVVSKYKALGAYSIVVKVDDYLTELLNMFISECGFCQMSSEKLWRMTKFFDTEYNPKNFRQFKNSDSDCIKTLYNNSILPHFRTLLNKNTVEFREGLFKGLSYFSEYKYVYEDINTKEILAYISLKTSDNENYIADITQVPFAEINICELLHFASDTIKKRQKRFGLFVKTKQYDINNQNFDDILSDNMCELVSTQFILTNSSLKSLKNEGKTGKYTVLNNFCPHGIIQT